MQHCKLPKENSLTNFGWRKVPVGTGLVLLDENVTDLVVTGRNINYEARINV